jgi:hypothetical protein
MPQIKLSPEAVDALRDAEAAFVDIFGRKPDRHDRIFVDFFRHGEDQIGREFESAANEAGIRPELIYAFRKTDRVLTDKTIKLVTDAEREEWIDAIEEYRTAREAGHDLLELPDSPVRDALAAARKHIDRAVIHFGSYADRAPPRTRKRLPLFLQFLLISQCHRHSRSLADGLIGNMGDEAFPLVRSIYECALLIARLEHGSGYADALIAQALVGTELYGYRTKKDGNPDYSRIVSHDGKEFPGRNSFYQFAQILGGGHISMFDSLYPVLSNQVHFDTLASLQRFQASGEFLAFNEPDFPSLYATALLVIAYTSAVLERVNDAPRLIRRDAGFLRRSSLDALNTLRRALTEEGAALSPFYGEIQNSLESI